MLSCREDTIVEVFSVDLLCCPLRRKDRWLRRLRLDDCCDLYCRRVVVMRGPSDEHPSGTREVSDRELDHLGFLHDPIEFCCLVTIREGRSISWLL